MSIRGLVLARLRSLKRHLWESLSSHLYSPHLLLTLTCVVYMVVGALIFQILEGQNLTDTKIRYLSQIEQHSDEYAKEVWRVIHTNQERYLRELSTEKANREVREVTSDKFGQYLDTVFSAHRACCIIAGVPCRHYYIFTFIYIYRSVRHGFEEHPPTWDFKNSLFFTATMLTSIGFGYVCPITLEGRMFGVVYCLFGIPLTLVTVATIAKTATEFCFRVHYKLWELWMRHKRGDEDGRDYMNDIQQIIQFDDSEAEEEILDRVKLVRFPPIVVFLVAIVYGIFGAMIIQRNEKWSYTESLYFTFIGILTVGFGDYRPAPKNTASVCVVITGGIILTTMCMDLVGRLYLKEIHYLGRKLRTNNPFYLLREAKTKRRRAAMASLLAQLARGMIFAHRNFNELQRKISRKHDRRRQSYNLPDGRFMFARLPPDPPRDCQVVSSSAYSVRLAWSPAFSENEANVSYNVRYRQKYHNFDAGRGKSMTTRELKGLQETSAEIMSLESCSLYEFQITAVSKYGESKPVILVQYTEPQLSPQHIIAKKLSPPNIIELTWEPPYKRTNQVKHYTIYWTDNTEARLADWQKMTVYGRRVVFPDLEYDSFYMFSANTCFSDGQRSPLSRALFIKTGKLEMKSNCIGHSRTVEIMQSIYEQKVEISETSPLLKRDFASFAV